MPLCQLPESDRFCVHVQYLLEAGGTVSCSEPFISKLTADWKALRITQGKEFVKEYHDLATASGKVLVRTFCSNCGSNLFLYNDTNTFVTASFGTLDEPSQWGEFCRCQRRRLLDINPS